MQQCLEARIGILVTQQDINFLLRANCNSQIQNLSQSKPELFSFFFKSFKTKTNHIYKRKNENENHQT